MKNNVIWVSLYQNGQRVRKSTKLPDTRENRKRVERDLIPKLEKNDFTPKKTVAYYYERMMRQKDLKGSSVRRYGSIFENHIQQFGNREIDSFKVSELKEWMSKSLSPKSLRLNATVFRQIFDEALYDEAIDKNPFEHIKPPKLNKFEPQPFNSEEVELLINNATGWFKNLLAVLFMTGMRIGEAIALEWKDIDDCFIKVSKTLAQGEVSSTKTDNIRDIPIFDDLRPYLYAQRLETGHKNRVFVGLNDPANLQKRWHALLKKCEMPHRILYQARHTFAINALDSGLFKTTQIAKMLGHSSVQMLFTKYAKFIKSEIDIIPRDFSVLGTKKRHQSG